jgi:hypothetical protein
LRGQTGKEGLSLPRIDKSLPGQVLRIEARDGRLRDAVQESETAR